MVDIFRMKANAEKKYVKKQEEKVHDIANHLDTHLFLNLLCLFFSKHLGGLFYMLIEN